MTENRLHVVQMSSSSSPQTSFIGSRLTRQKEKQALFERLWLVDPDQFNPLRNWKQKERLERTWTLLNKHVELANKKVADIGCGEGVFSRLMRDAGAHVEAVDIAENALKRLRQHDMRNIETKRAGMPETHLPDSCYDAIICTEIIAELNKEDYRLFFAELARLIKPDGCVVCSTPIDIYTEGGVERFADLAQTEFDLIDSQASYHALYIRLKKWLETPNRFIRAWKDPGYKQNQLAHRAGFRKRWFAFQTSPFLIWLWYALAPFANLLLKPFRTSRNFLLRLEDLCQFIWDERGISHYLFIAKRRPLQTLPVQEQPIERPKKREVWE